MRSVKGALSLALVLSCAPTVGDPGDPGSPMRFSIRSPNLRIDRITSQFHLRIFPRAGLTCDASRGVITDGMGAPAVSRVGGQAVAPHIRCNASVWSSMMNMFNPPTAMPVDLCFDTSMGQRVQLPAGDYLVLVEGSGQVMTVGGGTMEGLLGTGCGAATIRSGQTQDLAIVLREVVGAMGSCDNGTVEAGESCDERSDNCENCQYPERTVNDATMGAGRVPSATWASNQPLVVGFQAGNADPDAFVRFFQPDGRPLTMPAFLTGQYRLQALSRGSNEHVAVGSNDTTFVAAWQTTRFSSASYDVALNTFDSYQPSTQPMPVTAHPMRGGPNRTAPTIAVNGTSVLTAWVDDSDNSLRVSRTTTTAPPMMPGAETRPVMGMPAGMGVAEPRAVATATGFIVAWTAGTTGARDVYAMAFNTMGVAQGMPVRANEVVQMDQDQVAIAVNGDRVVMAWRDASRENVGDADGTTIRWRRFNAMLVPMDMREGLAVTSATGDQNSPAIGIGANGKVLVAWSNVADGFIRARYFNFATGESAVSRLGNTTSDFRLDDPLQGGGARISPVIAYGGVGRFAVVWEQMSPASGQTAEVHMRVMRDD